jgi:hypothetical protein
VLHDLQIVADEQVGELLGRLQILQQVDDLRLDRHVERADRLVAHEEAGPDRERARDADALALAAGELVRVAGRRVGGQADLLQQRRDPLAALALAELGLVDLERLADRGADAHARVERRVGVLEDHLHPLAQRPHRRVGQARDVLAVEADRAAGRLQQPQHGAAERRLAAARLADQAERLAGRDRQRHVLDGAHQRRLAGERAPQPHLRGRRLARPRDLGREVLADAGQLEQRGHVGTSTGAWQRTR